MTTRTRYRAPAILTNSEFALGWHTGWAQGSAARLRGELLTANPYPPESNGLRAGWRSGWMGAYDERDWDRVHREWTT